MEPHQQSMGSRTRLNRHDAARKTHCQRGRLFSEGDQPLTDTHLYPNDPGLFGPDSISWKVMAMCFQFAGGVRALLLQALHPEVAAGVADHSVHVVGSLRSSQQNITFRYHRQLRFDARSSLSGTNGTQSTPTRYRCLRARGLPPANQPPLAAWVQNTLTDSFLEAHQTSAALEQSEADQFVQEQSKIGSPF